MDFLGVSLPFGLVYWVSSAIGIVVTIVALVIGYRLLVWAIRYFAPGASGSFGDEMQPLGDPTRYALAAALLEGSPFRRRVMDIADHPFRARAPEIGLDFPLLLAACERWERQDRNLNLSIVLLLLYAFLFGELLVNLLYYAVGYSDIYFSTAVWLRSLQPVALIAVVVVVVVKAFRDEGRLKALRRDTFDVEKLRTSFRAEKYSEFAPQPQDNVICYGTGEPFRGFGKRIDGWQVAVELDRAAQDPLLRGNASASANANGDGGAALSQVNIGDLLTSVDQSVNALSMANLEMRFPLFVSGTEVCQLGPVFMADKFQRPVGSVDAQTLGHYWFETDPRARSYRCYTITDWNGELVFSYLLRFVRRGQSLSIETSQLVLAPVDARYRKIDAMRYRGILGSIFWFFRVVARTPITIWSAIVSTFYHLGELVGLAGFSVARERREVDRNPAYNYGARNTIREHLASRSYNAHFQFIDGRQYFKTIDQRVLNAIVTSLAASGVDVSGLVEQAQTVINGSVNMTDNSTTFSGISGSTISTGPVGAGAAVGAGAKAMAQAAAGGKS